jgi:hypothetical protein
VFSPSQLITRALSLHEIAALCDFMLEDEKELPLPTQKSLLLSLLHAPPGKLLQKFAYGPLCYLWKQIDLPALPTKAVNLPINFTLTTVENEAIKDSHLKASWSDDAPIDFEIWAWWPNESELQTRLAIFCN